MKIDYKFLKSYLRTNLSPLKIVEIFTNLGLECELSKDSIHFDLTPNRADAFSLLGLAREFYAYNNQEFKLKALNRKRIHFKDSKEYIRSVHSLGCQNYHLLIVDDIKIKKSLPKRIKNLLEVAGIPLVHPLVDLGNYVMLELGAPLHVFDKDKITFPITVGYPDRDEKVQVIGNEIKIVDKNTLTIRDQKECIALAGIIGNLNTSVSRSTSSIAVESASFLSKKVINKARSYGLNTEASIRFERGVDPCIQDIALNYFLYLLDGIASFKRSYGFCKSHKMKPCKTINFNIQRFNKLSGLDLSLSFAKSLFVNLGFNIERSNKNSLFLRSPSYRFDIEIPEDLYEEILRHYGYNNVPLRPPKPSNLLTFKHLEQLSTIKSIASFLINRGYQEMMHVPFVNSNPQLNDSSSDVKVMNPINNEEPLLRNNLIVSLLNALSNNLKKGHKRVLGFEAANIFYKTKDKFAEEPHISGIGYVHDKYKDWSGKHSNYNFFDLKKDMLDLLKHLNINDYSAKVNIDNSIFNANSLSILSSSNDELMKFGEINQALYGSVVKNPVYGFQILPSNLYVDSKQPKQINIPSKYPLSERDLNFVLDARISFSEVYKIISSLNIKILKDIRLIDLFSGKGLKSNKISMTLRFVLQSNSKSLTDEEVNLVIDRIHKSLVTKLSATLRK